jgi:microcystin-dependent protein
MKTLHTRLAATPATPSRGMRRVVRAAFALLACVLFVSNVRAQATLGEIDLVPYNFAMRGFADCSGQIMSIAQNTALFSILGTTYGGNGQTTFALPNLNDRIPINVGQAPGLSGYSLGQSGGTPTVTLTASQLPIHNHLVNVNAGAGTAASPAGNFYASSAAGVPSFATASNSVLFNATAVGIAGGSQPHNNWQPYLGLKWVIALQGVFPQRP